MKPVELTTLNKLVTTGLPFVPEALRSFTYNLDSWTAPTLKATRVGLETLQALERGDVS